MKIMSAWLRAIWLRAICLGAAMAFVAVAAPAQNAATVPQFTWSDLTTALNPNGSSLDYVVDAPYLGGGHRFGIQNGVAMPAF